MSISDEQKMQGQAIMMEALHELRKLMQARLAAAAEVFGDAAALGLCVAMQEVYREFAPKLVGDNRAAQMAYALADRMAVKEPAQ